jgi:hypothetical protein
MVGLAASSLSTTACEALLGIETLSVDPAGGVPCQTPADCPQGGSGCYLRECVGGVCGLREAPAGTPTASQVEGDCQVVTCDASGTGVGQPDAADAFNDGNDCTTDQCGPSGAENPPTAAGSPCAAGVCDGQGSCVECVSPSDCAATGGTCISNQCVPATCGNSSLDGDETDVDCGGSRCPPCGTGKTCEGDGDCQSFVCNSSACQAPSCEDGKRNADETDVDCGGGCEPCPSGKKCEAPTDCVDLVCGCEGVGCQPVCEDPTCSDGVKNGDEWADDCGPDCPGACDDGEPCEQAGDCASGVCEELGCDDASMACCQAPSCEDGVKNQGEAQIDCGGPCDPCPG